MKRLTRDDKKKENGCSDRRKNRKQNRNLDLLENPGNSSILPEIRKKFFP